MNFGKQVINDIETFLVIFNRLSIFEAETRLTHPQLGLFTEKEIEEIRPVCEKITKILKEIIIYHTKTNG